MNKSTFLIAALGGAVVIFIWYKATQPKTAANVRLSGGATPVNNAGVTSKSQQLQDQLVGLGVGLVANYLDGHNSETVPDGANGGVNTNFVQSTAPTSMTAVA